MQISIKNPNKLPTIDIRQVIPLQENLKDLDTIGHDKLLANIQKRGFDIPIIVWKKTDAAGEFYMLDGHQRQRVFLLNELNDNGNYNVPYYFVEAPTKREAVERLLEIASQFGEATVPGLDELASLYELDTDTMDIRFDAVDLQKLWGEPDEEPEKKDKPAKVESWTIEQLNYHRREFEAATGKADDGFISWLEQQ